ncbi:unnamed protein product [Nezara viridula]|uniref:Tubulin alpha chain n=1 Tax=Nezara viridula TaxID=85310 RepID=A0A9P0EDC7_NEZVI|nr:unnamed protein product [Nezara viridula]
MRGEVISIHNGQAGVEMGNACWELYCLEQNVSPTGEVKDDSQGNLDSFFSELESGKRVPRAVFVDLEPTVIDQIRTGKFKSLFRPENLLNGIEDAANNFARGRYTVGLPTGRRALEILRKLAESADQLQGFFTFHSYGGGTGSGLSTLISSDLSIDYPKKSFLEIAIFPSHKLSTAVVEPYNAVLSTKETLDDADCVFLADNEAMSNICKWKLSVDHPMYSHLNRLVAQTVSAITTSLRFEGDLNADFVDFQTNLVPYPRIHFPIVGLAPIVNLRKSFHETFSVQNITSQCFDSSSRLAMCDLQSGLYMACCLLYRGDVAPKDVNSAIRYLKDTRMINFVRWSPTGFKVGINFQNPISAPELELATGPRSVVSLSNNTAVGEMWLSLLRKHQLMADKKAFFHWYLKEGLEVRDFDEASSTVETLAADYASMDIDNVAFY